MKIAGIELKEAGYKPEMKGEGMVSPMPPSPEGDEKRYPSMFVDDKEMPAIKDKEYGDKCILVAIVKVRRQSKEETTEDGKKTTRTTMDLRFLKVGLKDYSEKSPSELADAELNEKIAEAVKDQD